MDDHLYFHYCLEESRSVSNTIRINVNLNTVVKSLLIEAQNGLNSTTSNVRFQVLSVSKNLNSKPLNEDMILKYVFESGDDIFCKIKVDTVIPVESQSGQISQPTKTIIESVQSDSIKQQQVLGANEDLKFIALSKYSFYDDDKFVKVMVPLTGVGSLPKENITWEFHDRSFLIKIVGLSSSNYRYGVSRTHNALIPDQSKIIIKQNEIVVKLKKFKSDEHWSFLHRTKMVGDTD